MTWLSDDGPWIFLVLTVILGGGAAFLAGRGLARSWKPLRRIFFYMALLAAAVRFFTTLSEKGISGRSTTISSPTCCSLERPGLGSA